MCHDRPATESHSDTGDGSRLCFLRFCMHLTSTSSALHGNSTKVRKYVCYWLSDVLTRGSDVAVERDINNFECVDGCLDFL